jgi:hypothetical protein
VEATKEYDRAITITNTLGQLIRTSMIPKGTLSQSLNITDMAPGLYLLKTWDGASSKTTKLFIYH